jgi:hypothetical protein
MVVPPVATFLENKGSDDAGITIFGPKIPGTAKTGDVPAWCGNCLNLSQHPVGDGQMRYRIWTRTHSSPNEGNIPHLAKHRGEPGDLPSFLEDKQGEPPFSTASLKHIFRTLDQKLAENLRMAAARYTDAPVFVPWAEDEGDEVVSEQTVSVHTTPVRAMTPLPPIAGMVPVSQMSQSAVGGVPMPPAGVPMPPMGVAPPPPLAPVPVTPGAVPAVSPAAAQAQLHLVPPPTLPTPAEAPAAPTPTSAAPSTAAAAPAVPPPTRAVSNRSKRPALPAAGETK